MVCWNHGAVDDAKARGPVFEVCGCTYKAYSARVGGLFTRLGTMRFWLQSEPDFVGLPRPKRQPSWLSLLIFDFFRTFVGLFLTFCYFFFWQVGLQLFFLLFQQFFITQFCYLSHGSINVFIITIICCTHLNPLQCADTCKGTGSEIPDLLTFIVVMTVIMNKQNLRRPIRVSQFIVVMDNHSNFTHLEVFPLASWFSCTYYRCFSSSHLTCFVNKLYFAKNKM